PRRGPNPFRAHLRIGSCRRAWLSPSGLGDASPSGGNGFGLPVRRGGSSEAAPRISIALASTKKSPSRSGLPGEAGYSQRPRRSRSVSTPARVTRRQRTGSDLIDVVTARRPAPTDPPGALEGVGVVDPLPAVTDSEHGPSAW